MNSRKFKARFEAELKFVAENDRRLCGEEMSEMWCFVAILAHSLVLDIQDIEGLNSLIKIMCNRAPSMSQMLLDARLKIKRSLGQLDPQHAIRKWSERRPHVAKLLQSCQQQLVNGAYDKVVERPHRWRHPIATSSLPSRLPLQSIDPERFTITKEQIWACK